MPLNDFQCKKCKITEEHLVAVDEIPNCLICNKPMKKVVSVPARFILKGNGFYKKSRSE